LVRALHYMGIKAHFMKTLIPLVLMFVVSSCDIYVNDPFFDQRNQVVGSYQVREYSETYNSTWNYAITVSKAPYSNQIYLKNFYNAGLTVIGYVSGNKVTISWQSCNGYEIEGVGTIVGYELRLSYSVRDSYYRTTDFCTSTAWR
jgi:hypothetical protein